MAYQEIPRFNPNYGNRYGFRQLPAPTTGMPGDASTPQLASNSATRLEDYSGTSAEDQGQVINQSDGDSEHGPGSTIGGGPVPQINEPQYASQKEALIAALAGYDAGYLGTVQDVRQQADQGNQRAANALGGFVQRTANNPTGFGPKAPGLLGYAAHYAGLDENPHGGVTQNVQDAIYGLEESGNLYSDDNSSGYQGNTLTQQQNLSDIHAATVYGDWSAADRGAPETFADEPQSFQDNYDYYQDQSNDDGGDTTGSQTGGETSHGGGSSGISFADDAAVSDSGGGGGK